MEGIQLPTALALLLRADMVGVRPRPRKRRHDILFALDLAANVAHEPVQPRAQDVQLPFVALELLGMSVASRHHRRALGDAYVGLAQRHTVLLREAVEAFDRRMQQLGVGWEGDVLGLHRGVDRDPLKVAGPQRAAGMRHPQALGQ